MIGDYNQMSDINSYRTEKENIRKNLLKYTIKAYKFLPKIKGANILDVGCGSGIPTIELAKLSKGHVTGIDIDEDSLKILKRKIKDFGLKNQMSVIKESINTMDFPKESFDIIWSEGAVFVIGFENSIKKWRLYLKPKGFLVIHDEIKDKSKKLEIIDKYGYKIISQFDLPFEIWWDEYFAPLEQLVKSYRKKYTNDSELGRELKKDQRELVMCKSNKERASSFYVIIQKV